MEIKFQGLWQSIVCLLIFIPVPGNLMSGSGSLTVFKATVYFERCAHLDSLQRLHHGLEPFYGLGPVPQGSGRFSSISVSQNLHLPLLLYFQVVAPYRN